MCKCLLNKWHNLDSYIQYLRTKVVIPFYQLCAMNCIHDRRPYSMFVLQCHYLNTYEYNTLNFFRVILHRKSRREYVTKNITHCNIDHILFLRANVYALHAIFSVAVST